MKNDAVRQNNFGFDQVSMFLACNLMSLYRGWDAVQGKNN